MLKLKDGLRELLKRPLRNPNVYYQDIIDKVSESIDALADDEILSPHEIGVHLGKNLRVLLTTLDEAREAAKLPIETDKAAQLQSLKNLKEDDLIQLQEDLDAAISGIDETTDVEVEIALRPGERATRRAEVIGRKRTKGIDEEVKSREQTGAKTIGDIESGVRDKVKVVEIGLKKNVGDISDQAETAATETKAKLKRRAEGGTPITGAEIQEVEDAITDIQRKVERKKKAAVEEGLKDMPLYFATNPSTWVNDGLNAEIPRVMQIAYLEEILKQSGLTGRAGKLNYRELEEVLDAATTPDKLNMLDPDLQEILDDMADIKEPLRDMPMETMAEHLKAIDPKRRDLTKKAGWDADKQISDRRQQGADEAEIAAQQTIKDVGQIEQRRVTAEAETTASLDRIKKRMDATESDIRGDASKKTKARTQEKVRQERKRIARFEGEVTKLNQDFDKMSDDKLREYKDLYVEAEASWVNAKLGREDYNPAQFVSDVIAGRYDLDKGEGVVDRMLLAIMKGDINQITDGMSMDAKQIIESLAKGKLKPLPDSAKAGFLIEILTEAGILNRGGKKGTPGDPKTFVESLERLKEVLADQTEYRMAMFFGDKTDEYSKLLDECFYSHTTQQSRKR